MCESKEVLKTLTSIHSNILAVFSVKMNFKTEQSTLNICHYCNQNFTIKIDLLNHISTSCLIKNYSLHHQVCKRCNIFFKNFSDYSIHIKQTGHTLIDPNVTNTFTILEKSNYNRNRAEKSNKYTKHSSYLIFPSNSTSNDNSDKSSHKHTDVLNDNVYNTHATLYFGAVVQSVSLLGCCSWILCNDPTCTTTFTNNSTNTTNILVKDTMPIYQPYISLINLEYQALLHGLITAIKHKITHITILTTSSLIISHIHKGIELPYLTTIYAHLSIITIRIRQLLRTFHEYTFAPTTGIEIYNKTVKLHRYNYDCILLAKEALVKYKNDNNNNNKKDKNNIYNINNVNNYSITFCQDSQDNNYVYNRNTNNNIMFIPTSY